MARYMKRAIGVVVLISLMMTSLQMPVYADMVGTAAVIDQQQAVINRGKLLTALNRDDVKEQLVAMGVDPKAARERVASLSDEELQSLNGHMKELPAGGDILGVALIVFLVLLFTDIMGYTDVFPVVKKTVH